MRRARNGLLPIPVEPELKVLIKKAAHKTKLSQADVMRSALRLGVPELVKRLETKGLPRRNFADYVGLFAGVVRRNRELVKPSRVK
jgi:hypothetical protein